MWALASQSTSCPGATRERTASTLAIEPVGMNSAASCPNRPATRSSSRATVGSSPYTSSPTSARAIACRIASVGRVRVSLRRSITCSRLPQHLGDQERQLQGLHPVQARGAHRLVAVPEVDLEQLLAAADALGDVVAGELDVDAAGPGPERAVHVEEPLHLLDDVVEAAGLVARARLEGVAMHRVADPGDLD